MSRYRTPTTQQQALAEAFYLALIAPGESERRAAELLAEQYADGLDESTIEIARAAAHERYEADADGDETWVE